MRVAADTNVLVRALTDDDPRQSPIARAELANADLVAVAIPALCELVWVLSRIYEFPPRVIAEGIRRLTNAGNVVVNKEAGLANLEAGGDFADAVIAYEGSWLGAETFLSFDRKAAKLIEAQGTSVRLLS